MWLVAVMLLPLMTNSFTGHRQGFCQKPKDESAGVFLAVSWAASSLCWGLRHVTFGADLEQKQGSKGLFQYKKCTLFILPVLSCMWREGFPETFFTLKLSTIPGKWNYLKLSFFKLFFFFYMQHLSGYASLLLEITWLWFRWWCCVGIAHMMPTHSQWMQQTSTCASFTWQHGQQIAVSDHCVILVKYCFQQ